MTIDFNHDYHLENDRVKLEPLQADHLEKLLPLAAASEIWTFFDEGGTDAEDFKNYISSALNHRWKGNQYPFIIFDKQKKQYAGMTRLYAYDAKLKTIKLGHTWIGLEFQGTGLNKACKHCMLSFVFDRYQLARVGFGVHEQNLKSIHAMKRIGAIQEGGLRNFLYKIDHTERCELLLFSITQEDWQTKVNKHLDQQF